MDGPPRPLRPDTEVADWFHAALGLVASLGLAAACLHQYPQLPDASSWASASVQVMASLAGGALAWGVVALWSALDARRGVASGGLPRWLLLVLVACAVVTAAVAALAHVGKAAVATFPVLLAGAALAAIIRTRRRPELGLPPLALAVRTLSTAAGAGLLCYSALMVPVWRSAGHHDASSWPERPWAWALASLLAAIVAGVAARPHQRGRGDGVLLASSGAVLALQALVAGGTQAWRLRAVASDAASTAVAHAAVLVVCLAIVGVALRPSRTPSTSRTASVASEQ